MREEIEKIFRGEVLDDEATLKMYSRDASLFEVRPKLVVYPKDSDDIKALVKWVNNHGRQASTVNSWTPGVHITVRAAGTDMTGGPLNESIVADVTKHLNQIKKIEPGLPAEALAEAGVFYRDFEKKTLEQGLVLPCYPASKSLCALGGMFGNNCAGERSLRYGKMEHFVLETKVVFADGNEYLVKPMPREVLDVKMRQGDFEGNLYKNIYNLLEDNKQVIRNAKPKVSKNSAGYYLWNVWDGETFDLNKLLVGSQGTLGIVTEIKLRLVPEKKYHDMVALFFKSWKELPQVINRILPFEPESLETFDEDTLKLGIRFMPEIARKTGSSLLLFATRFLPELMIGFKMLGLPKLIVLVEVAEDTEREVKRKVESIVEAVEPFNIWSRVIEKDSEEEKFWVMRRESFNLLRQHSGDKRTAPFVEDFCITAEKVPEFLPKALKFLKDAGIQANIAGHAGNGNFHIIPLMDLSKESERAKIVPVAHKFYDLVAEYEGSNTAEHNDGILRTPFLGKMYDTEVLGLFKKTKQIFDPQNIFNPGKKVACPPLPEASDDGRRGGTLEYLESHIQKG